MNNLDVDLFHFLNGFAGASKMSDLVIIFLANYLPYLLIFIFIIILLKTAKNLRWKFLMISVASAFASRFVITEIIRFLYYRPRPFMAMHVTQLVPENKASFPSGHMTFFFAIAMSVYFYNKKWGIIFFVVSFLIGIARIMAGVHYPTDIVGGALIGIATACLVYSLQKRFLK